MRRYFVRLLVPCVTVPLYTTVRIDVSECRDESVTLAR